MIDVWLWIYDKFYPQNVRNNFCYKLKTIWMELHHAFSGKSLHGTATLICNAYFVYENKKCVQRISCDSFDCHHHQVWSDNLISKFNLAAHLVLLIGNSFTLLLSQSVCKFQLDKSQSITLFTYLSQPHTIFHVDKITSLPVLRQTFALIIFN